MTDERASTVHATQGRRTRRLYWVGRTFIVRPASFPRAKADFV